MCFVLSFYVFFKTEKKSKNEWEKKREREEGNEGGGRYIERLRETDRQTQQKPETVIVSS